MWPKPKAPPPSEWHVSRAIRLGDELVRVEGPHPANRYVFEPGYVGEHARWLLEMAHKYEYRWPWWQVTMPPRLSELRFYPLKQTPTTIEWTGGWLLTLWALWKALR